MKYFHNKLLNNLLTKFLNIDNSTMKAGRGKFELINGVYSVPDSPTIIEFECYLLIEGDESTVVFRWRDLSNPKMTTHDTMGCHYAIYKIQNSII